MKRAIMISMIVAISFLTACSTQFIQTMGATKYYVQVTEDGTAYEDHGITRYEYYLTGFDKEGENKELNFTAGHELKEDAYLIIYYKKDEVIRYEEVASDDVPEKAMEKLAE